MTLEFVFEDGRLADRADVLSVDGVFGVGPNLSHWPGNRTPKRYRHDLSTGMALALARDPRRDDFLAGVTTVANNHYDTDGLCSAFAVLFPKEALRLEPLLMAAARAGDLEEVDDWRGLAADAVVTLAATHPESPWRAGCEGLSDDARHAHLYRALIDALPDLLVRPSKYEPIWGPTVEAYERGLGAFESGRVRLELREAEALAVVLAPTWISPHAIASRTRGYSRILEVLPTIDGPHFRFRHTTHSWFDFVTPAPRRFPLAPVADALRSQETAKAGAWIAESDESPVARLTFGEPAPRRTFTEDGVATRPSRLHPDAVAAALARAAASVA